MNTNHTQESFKKLLDKLQTESWQLELLISGFAIFGLFQAIDPIERELLKAIGNEQQVYMYFIGTVYPTLTILLTVLLIHVVLRGVWIGAIGLRYVSGEIDYEGLNYSKKFTEHLTKKVGSFDRYISRLENICSTLFAIAFLMTFYFMAYSLVIVFFALVVNVVKISGIFDKDQLFQFNLLFGLAYFCMAFLFFVDFVGMGILKKGNLRPKIYFPIYRFFSLITLSFLYRPLVYNFLDQRRAKWLATFILPVYLLISFMVGSFTKQPSNYLVEKGSSSDLYASGSNYDDMLDTHKELVDFATIPSKVITTPYLPLKIPFTPFKEDAVFHSDSTLRPEKDKRGYGINIKKMSLPGITFTVNSENNYASQKKYLSIVNEMYRIYIDSTEMAKDFIYTTNEDERLQFETFLDISSVAKGKHLLYVLGPMGNNDLFNQKIDTDTLVTIPFWYFPPTPPVDVGKTMVAQEAALQE
jgi:hypothetical protein